MGRVLLGIGLVAAGVVLLLDVADVWDAGEVFADWWPLIIVAIGVAQLAGRPRPWLGAGIVIAIGLLLLLGELDALPFGWEVVWPVLLIVIGAWVLLSRAPRFRRGGEGGRTVNVLSVFADARSASSSPAFEGGSVTALLGGAQLDLRRAVPAAGGAELVATAIMGGVDLIVPHGWQITVSGLPIFGGVEDKTARDATAADGAPRLAVNGFALFGAVEVKHRD